MEIFIWIVSGVLAFIILIALVYIFFFLRPRKKKDIDKALLCEYAHRGLHSDTVPENSLGAFELACRSGHGIELDVQLSEDGQVMVFHDATLDRMTGVHAHLHELKCAQLQELKLAGTCEKIPTFSQVLKLVDGRVPLLVELKGETFDTALCEKVAELLTEYKGPYCIESFNPLLLHGIGKKLPESTRGILYTNVCREKRKHDVIHIALTLMAFNFVAKPSFIAFDKKDRNSLPVRLTTKFFKAPKFVWTIRGEGELKTARDNGELAIFERL